jgi:REP element-mobilizing transposase RayT
MPEHIHLLISEPAKGTPSTIMQVLKQRVSRQLRRKPGKKASSQQLRLPFRYAHDFLTQFWQPRFYDFTGAGCGRGDEPAGEMSGVRRNSSRNSNTCT